MLSPLDGVFLLAAFVAAIPCAVFWFECVLGALVPPARTDRDPKDAADLAPSPRTAVLVPAHDESAGISATLQGLRTQLGQADRLIVVADNCSDDTAAVAAASGAEVIERRDLSRRGKGYALAFGLEHLAASPPEVVIIVDADCQLSPGSLERLARLAHARARPVQADYVLVPPKRPQGLAVVSALAFLVKNRVRPRGLAALGLPCLLTGTGMAFPWHVIRMAPPTDDNLVEDMVMGLELARLGHPPLLCPTAFVSSALPERTQAASAQRKRWEHGHLATLLQYGPKLLRQGVFAARLDLIALALDLMVPPLSLLVALLLAGTIASAGLLLSGGSPLPLAVFVLNLGAITGAVLLGWHAHGRELVRGRDLGAIPLYLLWKLPLYFRFFARKKQATWERTERGADAAGGVAARPVDDPPSPPSS